MVMLWSCHRVQDPSLRFMSYSWFKKSCSSLVPWSKSPVRILASCHIVVYMSNESELFQNDWLWADENSVKDESEAMVIGEDGARRFQNVHDRRQKQLSVDGRTALIWGEVFSEHDELKFLPEYDELKFLHGNSGFAMVAVAVQAIGYIYAVVFRSAKDLRVAPVEVVGLVLNIVLLIKASLHGTCNDCHRPLVIYMNEETEKKFLNVLKLTKREDFDINDGRKLRISILTGIIVCLVIPLIYYIVIIMEVSNILVVLPLLFFLIGIFLQFLIAILLQASSSLIIPLLGWVLFILIFVVSAVTYIWAVVVTVVCWKSEHFNTRPELVNLSQLIPFFG